MNEADAVRTVLEAQVEKMDLEKPYVPMTDAEYAEVLQAADDPAEEAE